MALKDLEGSLSGINIGLSGAVPECERRDRACHGSCNHRIRSCIYRSGD